MYEVVKVMTNDGHQFDNAKEAKEYLEKEYTDLMCRISAKLVSIEKYQQMKEHLDSEGVLEQFEKALELKRELGKGVTKLWED